MQLILHAVAGMFTYKFISKLKYKIQHKKILPMYLAYFLLKIKSFQSLTNIRGYFSAEHIFMKTLHSTMVK